MSNKQTIVFDDIHWSYIPKAISDPDLVFRTLLEQIKDKVVSYQVSSAYAEGKTFPSRRLSCVFSDQASTQYNSDIPIYPWNSSSMIAMIKERIEQILGIKFDYVLCHLYRNGRDHISPHRDREAMIVMKPTCQHNYVHWVPEQKKISEPRINLTFRQNE